jgi:hypothetical protein
MPAGVILVSLRLDTLNRTVGWSELAADGYGLIVSRSGSYAGHPSGAKDGGFIAHPVKSYWRGSSISSNFYAAATFPEVARQTGNTQALKVLEPSSEGSGQTVLDYKDEVTKQDAWLFYSSIPTADWVLGYVLPKGVAVAGDKMDFRFQLWIVILIIAGVSLMIAAGTALMTRNTRQLWALAAIMTLAPIVAIGFIWNLSMAQENKPGLESSGVSLRQTVDEYKKYVSSVSPKLKVETVLAGVFLDTIKQKENRIDWEIAGTMWQRYLNGVPDGTKPGFLLPDAVNPPEFKSLYDMQSGSIRSIGWRFSATIRPKSDQSQYPIDNILVTLRFVHSQIERPIVLLPDVGEYDLTIPSSRPGLASSLVINGFRIKESYFNYVASNSNSTLGIPDFARQKATPEVEFKVQLSRNFLDPFISQMLPLIVVLGLLFAVHLMSTRPGEWQLNEDPNNVPGSVWQRVWYGRPRAEGDVLDEPKKNATSVYYTQATLTTVLGLMFVVIFSHHSLRASITSSEIIYLEYAYFVVYAALAMVTLNSLLFAAGRGGFIVQWRRNLIPELMYWPCITVAILIVTIIVFY